MARRPSCWEYNDGRTTRAEIRAGVSDGKGIEVTDIDRPTSSGAEEPWMPINPRHGS